jgi:hypothetical protein
MVAPPVSMEEHSIHISGKASTAVYTTVLCHTVCSLYHIIYVCLCYTQCCGSGCESGRLGPVPDQDPGLNK